MASGDLPLLVRDLMTVGVLTCPPETPIPELAQLLLAHDQDDVIVLDEGKALGTVGQEQLVAALQRDDARSLKAIDIMREGIPQIPPDIPILAAAQIMRDLNVRTLFLMHHAAGIEYPAAVIGYKHLLRYLAAESPDQLRDLGIRAVREPPLEVFKRRRDLARLRIKESKP
jgi:CBS domain-containing protein